MIPHDSDIDLVVREVDFARLVAIGNRLTAAEPGAAHIAFDASCSLSGKPWFESGSTVEIPYAGRGCKRVKFSLTEAGWAAVGLNCGPKRFPFDPCLVHLDVFTVSPHPLDPNGSLRVNWSVPGIYDCMDKRFPADCLFPAVPCTFESVPTFAPRDLLAYLTVEYGYLGRDAMYDSSTGLYVKIPPELRTQIPGAAARWADSAGADAESADVNGSADADEDDPDEE
ncbi:hypothetical protein BOX15_Mlig032626g1 [Macrostomum lignano]|nr:hypothetical protein BOX15_Mlig032626g1 [Macrostomum lignano]